MALVDPIDLSQFDLEPEPDQFEAAWQQYFSGADGLDTPDLIAASLLTLPDPATLSAPIDVPLQLASDSLDAEIGLPADPEFAKADSNAAPFADSFAAIEKIMPPQAFQALPQDLLPPPELGGFTSSGGGTTPGTPTAPIVPPSPGRPPSAGFGNGAGPLQPGALHPQVQIRNVTTPGAQSFNVGDYFELEVVGVPQGRVTVAATFNGVAGAQVSMGSLDQTGYFATDAQYKAAQRGEWYESWYVNGEICTPVLHFFVN